MEEFTVKRHAGMFTPGQSGNPSGRPKGDIIIKELAKEHSEIALNTLVEIATNKKSKESARVQAAVAILDRGWGKPSQSIENLNVNASLEDFLRRIAEQEGIIDI